jgi:predicted molibdopterin-dependent oxidoreductase YjgC
MNVTIDGKTFEAHENETVLALARRNGIYIPTLCFHPKVGKQSRCRVCIVIVQGMRGYQTACNLNVRDNMVVTVDTPQLKSARKMIVDFILSSGRHDCLSCHANGACELQEVCYRLGIDRPSFPVGDLPDDDASGEFIIRDHSKCIKCNRCVAACNESVVNEVLAMGFRGKSTKVICDDDLPMGTSTCVQCGECVQLCPTGALIDKKAKGRGRSWEFDKVDTTCAFCGVGCQLTLHVDRKQNRIARVTGRETAPNEGMLCVKGRYAYEFPSSPNRLTHPMIRKNGTLSKVSWDEALDYTASRIKTIIEREGPDVFSAFGSGRITNENNYAIQKFTRAAIGTNNIDHCART